MSIVWTSRSALRAKDIKSSAIRELLKITQRPEVISFAGGLPANDVFPIERFEEACRKVLEQNAVMALQYGETEGYKPLRDMIARHIARYGIKAQAQTVLITTRSQRALDLIGKLLINSGDRVLRPEARLARLETALCALLPVIGTAFVLLPAFSTLVFSGHWIKGLILLVWGLAVVHPWTMF